MDFKLDRMSGFRMSLYIQVWRSGIVPADWQEGIIITKARVLEHFAVTTDQLLYCRYLARYSPMFCWHAYNLLSTSLVVLSNQALLLAGQQLTPSSLCDSCQSYIVNLTGHWTLHSWTLSLLSTPSTALPSGKHFAAKAYPTSYSNWLLPFTRTPVHVSRSDRNCRREFPPPLVSGRVAS